MTGPPLAVLNVSIGSQGNSELCEKGRHADPMFSLPKVTSQTRKEAIKTLTGEYPLLACFVQGFGKVSYVD
jgi:hypothetical protein